MKILIPDQLKNDLNKYLNDEKTSPEFMEFLETRIGLEEILQKIKVKNYAENRTICMVYA